MPLARIASTSQRDHKVLPDCPRPRARMPELHLDLGRVSEIGNFTPFAGGDRDEAKPLSFEQHAVRTWLTRMEEAFAAFRRELALG
jgi:hypothetical protein